MSVLGQHIHNIQLGQKVSERDEIKHTNVADIISRHPNTILCISFLSPCQLRSFRMRAYFCHRGGY